MAKICLEAFKMLQCIICGKPTNAGNKPKKKKNLKDTIPYHQFPIINMWGKNTVV